jgi:proteic killer suppression protein
MLGVIKSFRDRTTEAVFNGESPKGFPADLVKVTRRKLRYLTPRAISAT